MSEFSIEALLEAAEQIRKLDQRPLEGLNENG